MAQRARSQTVQHSLLDLARRDTPAALSHLKGVGGKVLQTSFDQARASALREAIAAAAGNPSAK